MNSSKLRGLLAGALCGLVPSWGASNSPSPVSLTQWVPQEAVLCLEILQSTEVVEPFLRPETVDRIAGLPMVSQGRQTEAYQGVMGLVRYVEMSAQTNWQTVVRQLTRGGLVVAMGQGNRAMAVLAGSNADLLSKLHTLTRTIAASEAQKKGHPEWVDVLPGGGTEAWTFNGKEAHAVVGERLVLASDPEVLTAALRLRQDEDLSLAARADYQAARRAVGDQAVALAFLDLKKLREAPKFRDGLQGQGGNPLASLLFADLPRSLLEVPWLAVGVYLEESTLHLRFFSGPKEAGSPPLPFVPTGDEEGDGLALGVVPRQIASLALSRDLHTFYAAKDELFPQRTSGLIFFENMMGIFFSGRNLTDEVLAALQSDIRVVVAGQQYDPAIGTPDPQLPAFALVFGLRDPAAFNEVLEEAWQKALGLVNFTRGQKALPGLILDRVPHRGTPITVAAYSSKEATDRAHLDQRFNFRPALAMAHGAAILSSTDQLARDLLDALEAGSKAAARRPSPVHTDLTVEGQELAGVLWANRAAMVRNSMVKDGKTQAEAELGIGTLLTLAGWVEQFGLSVGNGEDGSLADLRLRLAQP